MNRYGLLLEWKKMVVIAGLATLIVALPMTTSFAAPSRSSYCRAYANDYSLRYSAGGAMGGVVRGAAGGALVGSIAGGGRGARRGALAGATVGGVSRRIQRSSLYEHAYARCMHRRWP